MGSSMAERRTIGNMALCFLSMGDVGTPLELLLHLWMAFSESPLSIETDVRPMALLLSSVGTEMEFMTNAATHYGNSTKMQLLWKLFHASSLAQDWATCLDAAEEMSDGDGDCGQPHEKHSEMARAFALLQCHRPSAAREIASLLSSKLVSLKSIRAAQPLIMMAELFFADALLQSEKSMGMFENECTPLICTQRGLDALASMLRRKAGLPDKMKCSPSLQELQVTQCNDHGIALLIAGDSVGALSYFRQAANHVSIETTNDENLSWLLLPTYFNLSLLLLRDGHMEESAKSWLRARGYFSAWQRAVRGDNESLRKLKDLLIMAINRHGLLVAKRSMKAGAMIADQETIMEWVPPALERGSVMEDSSRVGGVDASQITALDVVLLRYAVSHAEKKASASFRKKAITLGY